MHVARDIPAFVMYCVNGESGSSLLIESTYSMIHTLHVIIIVHYILYIFYNVIIIVHYIYILHNGIQELASIC